ncbi:MAG: hypothetical protein M3Y41_08570 [Pseudomonadota bacterium]|nr:hypothetical protein [Pseudomonadota bacterium]
MHFSADPLQIIDGISPIAVIDAKADDNRLCIMGGQKRGYISPGRDADLCDDLALGPELSDAGRDAVTHHNASDQSPISDIGSLAKLPLARKLQLDSLRGIWK